MSPSKRNDKGNDPQKIDAYDPQIDALRRHSNSVRCDIYVSRFRDGVRYDCHLSYDT